MNLTELSFSSVEHVTCLPDGVIHTAVGEQVRPEGLLLDLPVKRWKTVEAAAENGHLTPPHPPN